MSEKGNIHLLEQCHIVAVGEVRLKIVARFAAENEWTLRIENEKGISSNWTDIFSACDIAINAGLRAIESEGVDEFASIEGFEYLE